MIALHLFRLKLKIEMYITKIHHGYENDTFKSMEEIYATCMLPLNFKQCSNLYNHPKQT